jgi:hypothetical protein
LKVSINEKLHFGLQVMKQIYQQRPVSMDDRANLQSVLCIEPPTASEPLEYV